jgi:nickel transport protein
MKQRSLPLLAAAVSIALAVSLPSPALAHKVIASGYAAGDAIEGEIGFSNGDVVAQTTVTITDPNGTPLGEVKTDSDGFFRFVPSQAVPHIFRSDLGSGHVAEFRMEVSELPHSVQTLATATPAGALQPPSPVAPLTGLTGVEAAELRDMIALAVRDEIRPLRRELIANREQASIQSILGGLGTILGLVGVAFYMMARRKLAEASALKADPS